MTPKEGYEVLRGLFENFREARPRVDDTPLNFFVFCQLWKRYDALASWALTPYQTHRTAFDREVYYLADVTFMVMGGLTPHITKRHWRQAFWENAAMFQDYYDKP